MEPDREAARTPSPETPPDSGRPAPDASASGGGALGRLRDRVEAAAAEIERLRAENAALAERASGGGVPLDGDPEALRGTIQGFIDAVDRVLDGTPDAP